MIINTKDTFGSIVRPSTVQTFNSCTSRSDVCQCLVVQTPFGNMPKNKGNTLMTHEACESKLVSGVRSSIDPWPRNWVAIGCAVVYYAYAAHAFSALIKCRHCKVAYMVYFSTRYFLYTLFLFTCSNSANTTYTCLKGLSMTKVASQLGVRLSGWNLKNVQCYEAPNNKDGPRTFKIYTCEVKINMAGK